MHWLSWSCHRIGKLAIQTIMKHITFSLPGLLRSKLLENVLLLLFLFLFILLDLKDILSRRPWHRIVSAVRLYGGVVADLYLVPVL